MVTACSAIASSSALCVFGVARLHHEHVRSDDVARHKVGRELDARELQIEALRERAHEQRLAETGRSFEQHVPASREPPHHLIDHRSLPDDCLADRAAQCLDRRGRLLEPCFEIVGAHDPHG
jgi:hypothetical protein